MRQVIVLASGGLDSAACIAYYLAQGFAVSGLWVDYGQAAAALEEASAERVATHFGIWLRKVRVTGLHWQDASGRGNRDHYDDCLFEYRGRNLTLAALALNSAPPGPGLVALGIHAGTSFADCSDTFVDSLDRMLRLLSEDMLRLDCPFLSWPKLEIARYALARGMPIDVTYSCIRGLPGGCQECEKCRDVEAILTALQSTSAS